MNFEDSSPFVRQALVGHLTKNNRQDCFCLLKAPDARLFLIRNGSGFLRCGGLRFPLETGTVILLGPGEGYVWEVEDVTYYSVNFDFTRSHAHITRTFHPFHSENFSDTLILAPLQFDPGTFPTLPIVIQGFVELEPLLRQIVTEYQMGGIHSDAITSGLLKAAVARILRRSQEEKAAHSGKAAGIVGRVIEYIAANYSGELSNATLGEVFHFSPVYLNRIFKRYTGTTLHDFVVRYRIQVAMELLRSQNITVSEAGHLCGFSGVYHFSKAFHRSAGKTPTEFRQSGD